VFDSYSVRNVQGFSDTPFGLSIEFSPKCYLIFREEDSLGMNSICPYSPKNKMNPFLISCDVTEQQVGVTVGGFNVVNDHPGS